MLTATTYSAQMAAAAQGHRDAMAALDRELSTVYLRLAKAEGELQKVQLAAAAAAAAAAADAAAAATQAAADAEMQRRAKAAAATQAAADAEMQRGATQLDALRKEVAEQKERAGKLVSSGKKASARVDTLERSRAKWKAKHKEEKTLSKKYEWSLAALRKSTDGKPVELMELAPETSALFEKVLKKSSGTLHPAQEHLKVCVHPPAPRRAAPRRRSADGARLANQMQLRRYGFWE